MSPEETVRAISDSPTYHADMPVHFGSQTDAFSTPSTIAHYKEVLRWYGDSDYLNPLVFITKRRIPDDFMSIAREVPQQVVFYISYSGLAGTGLEPTVRTETLRENFIRLKERSLRSVHYWRPFMPQNSHSDAIAEVFEFVVRYASCSAVNGLKLNDGIQAFVAPYWPQLMAETYDFNETGDFWPTGVRSFVKQYARLHHPDYPLFFNTACSLAFVLDKPDMQGAFRGTMCVDSHCPAAQRKSCDGAFRVPTLEQLHKAAQVVALEPDQVSLEGGRILVHAKTPAESLVYLRSTLRFPVVSQGINYHGRNWANNIDAERAVVEVPWDS